MNFGQLYNLENDLKMTDTQASWVSFLYYLYSCSPNSQYLIALTIFFFSYAVFEVRLLSSCEITTSSILLPGPVQCFLEASSSFYLALASDVTVGYHDGMSPRTILFTIV